MARFANVKPHWRPVDELTYEDPVTGDRFTAHERKPDTPFLQTRVVVDGVVSDRWGPDSFHRPDGFFQIRKG